MLASPPKGYQDSNTRAKKEPGGRFRNNRRVKGLSKEGMYRRGRMIFIPEEIRGRRGTDTPSARKVEIIPAIAGICHVGETELRRMCRHRVKERERVEADDMETVLLI